MHNQAAESRLPADNFELKKREIVIQIFCTGCRFGLGRVPVQGR